MYEDVAHSGMYMLTLGMAYINSSFPSESHFYQSRVAQQDLNNSPKLYLTSTGAIFFKNSNWLHVTYHTFPGTPFTNMV